MSVPTSIIIGALIIAATIAFLFRWSVVVGPTTGERTDYPLQGIYRLDRWTGSVTWCRGALPGLLTPSSIKCDAK
jgi:hypothetical protein